MSYIVGLSGTRYNGYFNDNVNWFKTAPVHGDSNNPTSINNFSSVDDYYSWQWIGYFRANSNEAYTFYTNSDDASYLWLGNNAINSYTTENALVNNGGLHPTQEISGTSSVLVSGQYYPIRIQFGENEGGDIITVSFSTDTISKTTNGSGYYFYNNTVLNSLNLSGVYLGSNVVNKIYLGNNIVYQNNLPLSATPTSTPTPTPTPSNTPTSTPTPTQTLTPTPTPSSSATTYDYLTLVYDTNQQTSNNIITLPVNGSSPNITVNWGDGTSNSYTTVGNKTHNYVSDGIYTVTVSGHMSSFNYGDSSSTDLNKPKFIRCLSFGQIGITNIDTAFKNCSNFVQAPTSIPPAVTGIRELFRSSLSYNGPEVTGWNISGLSSLRGMFNNATGFNQNIGSWNTTNIVDMSGTFNNATSFNQNISSWSLSGLNSSTSLNNFMTNVTLSNSNYNAILIAWNNDKNSYRNDLSVNFGFSKYTSAAAAARSGLVSYGWVITDGGLQS